MEMTGEQLIGAPRAVVWAALNDPEILRQSIPGCDQLVKDSANGFAATVTARVGPVKATFKGKVTLTDIVPAQSYTLSGEGQGGVAGFGKGSAKVRLSDSGGGTMLTYAVEAQIGGKLAQIGSRLIDGVARKMAEDFFSRFNQCVAAQTGAAAAPGAPAVAPAMPPQAGLPTWVWVAGVTVIALLILMFLVRG
jgi:hypothetical protein